MISARPVRYSRTLGILDAVALSAPLTLAVAFYGVAPGLVQRSGEHAPLAFLLAIVVLLPVWLALVECGSVASGDGSFYSMSRYGASPVRTFATGWLALLGHLSVAALLAELAGGRLAASLEALFGLRAPASWWALLLLLLVGLRSLVGGLVWTRARTVFALGVLTIPVITLVVALAELGRGEIDDTWVGLGSPGALGVALLGAALWGITPVLSRRPELKRPGTTTLWAVIVVWISVMVMSALGTVLVLRHPEVRADQWIHDPDLLGDRLLLLVMLSLVMLCWLGLARTSSSAARLLDRMMADRFLPGADPEQTRREPSARAVLAFHLVAIALALLGPPSVDLAATAAMAFFAIAALVLWPWARLPADELPRLRFPRLPLHPLGPGFAIAVSVLLALLLLRLHSPVMALGSGLGALLWFSYARRAHLGVVHEESLVAAEEGPEAKRFGYTVLVAALDDETLPSLLSMAAALATRRDGQVLVLRVVERRSRAFPSLLKAHAESVREKLQTACEEATAGSPVGDRVQALVRIAPSEESGIVATVSEFDVDLLLLPWSEEEESIQEREESIVEAVFGSTSRSIAVLHGSLEGAPRKVTIAAGGGPNAVHGLELARDAAEEVELITVVGASVPPARGDTVLRATLAEAEGVEAVPQRSVSAPRVEEALVEESRDSDLLVVGAAMDRLLGRSYVGGVGAEVATRRKRATLLVKRSEPRAGYFLRRLWTLVSGPLPTLTVSERSEVFRAMSFAARADVDFYVLIVLSAAIATFGLRQNSTAVIIGAMLVAPLMSPILALANGLVQGHLPMMRRAAVSTAQGTAAAMGVSALVAVLLPEAPPTSEMLARSAPTLLDLAVAVAAGAAAAYGVSRRSVAAALPGVAIAVALVPPLCVAGHGLGASEFSLAAGSFLLYLTNLAGIVLVGALLFLMLGFRPSTATRDDRVRRGLFFAALMILLLAVPLYFQGQSLRRVQTVEAEIERRLERPGVEASVQNLRVRREGGEMVVYATIFVTGEVHRDDLLDSQQRLSERVGMPVRIEATLVQADQMSVGRPATVPEGGSGRE